VKEQGRQAVRLPKLFIYLNANKLVSRLLSPMLLIKKIFSKGKNKYD
jgi:hypothetical protein